MGWLGLGWLWANGAVVMTGWVAKAFPRTYRINCHGPPEAGKSTFWNLLRDHLRAQHHRILDRTQAPSALMHHRIYLPDSARPYNRWKGYDYPGGPEWVAAQIERLPPSDLVFLIDGEKCETLFGETDLEAYNSRSRQWLECLVPPEEDPHIQHLWQIKRKMASPDYRQETQAWGRIPLTNKHIRHHKRLTDFYLIFNKADIIPKDEREARITAILDYYKEHVRWIINSNEIRFDAFATSLTRGAYLPYEDLGGLLHPMAVKFTEIVNVKEGGL